MQCRWRLAITRRAVAAAKAWLESLCGDYAPLRRQFVEAYLRCVAAQIETHRAELSAKLAPYDGLYAPDDFLWSALRPLPRGWVPAGDQLLPADMVFWDGAQPIAIELAARDTDRQRALLSAGVTVYRIEPSMFARARCGFASCLLLFLGKSDAAVQSVPPRDTTRGARRTCHCERSEAISIVVVHYLDGDCFVAPLLTMTVPRCDQPQASE